ncbi:LOW QUALITY PROTEIN: multimerin-2-like [Scomber scombrus]|uniref:LOW QUALITY PROTEIN: multimerin-2-like n=1 Tax=Scomber scombrus TaxID=13677 RepID=A0AAV1QC97_SCOSC
MEQRGRAERRCREEVKGGGAERRCREEVKGGGAGRRCREEMKGGGAGRRCREEVQGGGEGRSCYKAAGARAQLHSELRTAADMVSVGELVLVLGLMVSAHCEVRARDPDVEEEEEEEVGGEGRAVLRVGGAGFGGVPHYLGRFHHGATERPLLADRETQPTRTGNWCVFEQQRVVTKAVKKTSAEKRVVKSESPCPSGAPDCRVVMYKLSPHTFYKQEQSVQTDHLWRCCPGHGGRNCEDTVPDARRDSGSSSLIGGSEAGRSADVHTAFQQQHGDPNREQNDHQPPSGELPDVGYLDLDQNNTTTQPPTQEPSPVHNPHHTPSTHKPDRPSHRAAEPYNHEHSIHHPPHLATDFYDHDHSYHHQPDRTADSHTHNPQHPPVRTADSQAHNPQHPSHRTADSQAHNPQHPPVRTADFHTYNPQHPPHRTADSDDHDRTNRQQEPPLPVVDVDAGPLPFPEAPLLFPEAPLPVLPAPHMMALVLSQLQPILQSFNRSLEHLRQQVEVLALDVSELKSDHLQAELDAELQASAERGEERLEAKLEEVTQQVKEVQRLMESQRSDMENRLHSQHMMLHYNISSFKVDVDVKLKRHQKMLQVSLQDMNATLTELKLDQDQSQDQNQDQVQVQVPDVQLDFLPPPPPPDSSALWEAIERLDNMVVNNTVKVGGLMEDVDVTSGSVQQLRQEVKELSEQMNQTARSTQVQYMLTVLEVEEAKVAVLERVEELAGNMSQHGQRMQELDSDVDYLYTAIYKQNSSSDCNCGALKAAVARLERGVANATELANENRLMLDESDGGGGGAGGDWEPAVEALQRGLQQVKESLSFEQTRRRTIELSLSQLRDSVSGSSSQVSELLESNRKVDAEMIRLTGSFRSLLKDTVRHSDVLELLLGEEVLEFLYWPPQDQEAHSIPALKEQLTLLQEQLRENEENIGHQQGHREEREEQPSADQPSSSSRLPGTMRRSSDEAPARERQLLLRPERRPPPPPGGDGSDLWNLEQTVEELRLKVLRVEEKQRNASVAGGGGGGGGVEEKLQAEVTWLKRGLEEHLKVFKNVFSNADVLVRSDETLELDKLWQLLKNKEKKRGGGGGGGGGGGREESERGNHRSRREVKDVPLLSSQSDASLLFLAASPRSSSDGDILFRSFLNRGQFHGGAFTAPADGIYLFVLTMDLQSGPAHVTLRRGGAGGGAHVSLQRGPVTEAGPVTAVSLLRLREGEELRPHLSQGAWEESEDNVFAVLLLHRTT